MSITYDNHEFRPGGGVDRRLCRICGQLPARTVHGYVGIDVMVAREEQAEVVMWAAGYRDGFRAGMEAALTNRIPELWADNELLDLFARRVAGREEWPR